MHRSRSLLCRDSRRLSFRVAQGERTRPERATNRGHHPDPPQDLPREVPADQDRVESPREGALQPPPILLVKTLAEIPLTAAVIAVHSSVEIVPTAPLPPLEKARVADPLDRARDRSNAPLPVLVVRGTAIRRIGDGTTTKRASVVALGLGAGSAVEGTLSRVAGRVISAIREWLRR